MSTRWLTATLLGMLLTTVPVLAQGAKRFEPDQAKKLAQIVAEATGKLANPPLKVKLDTEKSTGLGAEKRGALAVPDAGLTLDALKKLGKEIVPLGVIATHRITLVVAGQAIPAEQHRTVDVTIKDRDVKLAVFYLGVTKVAERPVVLVYSNGPSPALVTTLVETEDAREYPLDLEASKTVDNQARVILTVLGRYRAAFTIAGQD